MAEEITHCRRIFWRKGRPEVAQKRTKKNKNNNKKKHKGGQTNSPKQVWQIQSLLTVPLHLLVGNTLLNSKPSKSNEEDQEWL